MTVIDWPTVLAEADTAPTSWAGDGWTAEVYEGDGPQTCHIVRRWANGHVEFLDDTAATRSRLSTAAAKAVRP